MNKRLRDTLGCIQSAQKKRRRTVALMLTLSCIVSGNVYWQLRSIGIAMSDHAGSPDASAACEQTDASVSSGEIAAESALPAPPEAVVQQNAPPGITDREYPAADISDMTLRQAVAEAARSQLGYTGYSSEDQDRDVSSTEGGQPHFGAWEGDPACEWNTAFSCFCLHEAGVPEYLIPCGTDCAGWSARLLDSGLMLDPAGSIPEPGDLIFTDTDADRAPDRSGIVIGTETDENGNLILRTAEGCADGIAAEQQYLQADPRIVGIVPVITEPDSEPALAFTDTSESGVTVYASARSGTFPADTEMTVSDVPAETALAIVEADTELCSAVAVDITFRSPDGTEIEPASGSNVEVRIMLPETQHLPEGEYAVHHQKADGSVEEITDADLSAQAACFSADSFSIYVVTATGERDKDVLHESLDDFGGWLVGDGDGYFHNSSYKPYLLKKGDKITIVTKSRATQNESGRPFANNDRIRLTQVKEEFVTEDGTQYRKCTYEVEACSPGDTEILLDQTGYNEFEHFYIHVMENDSYQYRFSDICINGWPGSSEWNPLVIVKGETVTLYESYDRIYDYQNNTECFFTNANWNQRADLLSEFRYSDADGIRYATFTGVNNDDNRVQPVTLHMSNGQDWTVYVKVRYIDDNNMTHADIEIADGGTYTSTKKLINPDGSYTETVTRYKACVADVNHCDILNANGTVISSFGPEDYYRHGTPGSGTQYELTSNYKKCEDQSGATGIYIPSTGEYVELRDDPATNYTLIEADRAVFDVKLLLEPDIETVTKYDANGVPVGQAQTSSISDRENITIDSVIFNMDHQSVIDAHNKCPAHTGLDFTIMADLNEVLTDTVLLYTLPATGGSGTLFYYGIGIVCMAAAYLLMRRRNHRSEF